MSLVMIMTMIVSDGAYGRSRPSSSSLQTDRYEIAGMNVLALDKG